jgi:hypothetical protein
MFSYEMADMDSHFTSGVWEHERFCCGAQRLRAAFALAGCCIALEIACENGTSSFTGWALHDPSLLVGLSLCSTFGRQLSVSETEEGFFLFRHLQRILLCPWQ